MALPWSKKGEEGGTEQILESFYEGREAKLCLTVFSLN